MIGTFKANIPYNNFLLLLYAIVLRLPSFLFPEVILPTDEDATLYKYLLTLLKPAGSSFPLIYPLICLVLLYAQAVWINKIINLQKLFARPNYLTGMGYLLVTAMFTDWYRLSAPMLVSTIFIWVWSKLINLHGEKSPKTTIFNIGFFTSVAAFIYTPGIAFIILIMVGLTIARPFQLTEWLIGLIGLITPYYFFSFLFYLTNRWGTMKNIFFSPHLPKMDEPLWTFVGIIAIFFTVVLGIFFIQQNMMRQIVKARKSWQLLYLYFAVAVLVPFINTVTGFDFWILAAAPSSVFIAGAFYYPDKKLFPQIIHWCMVGICIAAFVALLNEKGIVFLP